MREQQYDMATHVAFMSTQKMAPWKGRPA